MVSLDKCTVFGLSNHHNYVIPQLQRSVKEYVIPYERLSTTMQKLNQSGCEILSLTHP